MARHLNSLEVEKIVSLLLGWKGTLTWEHLTSACEHLIGRAPSRQTLNRSYEIKVAYQSAKRRTKLDQTKPANLTLEAALARIDRLEAENHKLKMENNSFYGQFMRWQYNAYKRGIKRHQLDEELPKIDLGRS